MQSSGSVRRTWRACFVNARLDRVFEFGNFPQTLMKEEALKPPTITTQNQIWAFSLLFFTVNKGLAIECLWKVFVTNYPLVFGVLSIYFFSLSYLLTKQSGFKIVNVKPVQDLQSQILRCAVNRARLRHGLGKWDWNVLRANQENTRNQKPVPLLDANRVATGCVECLFNGSHKSFTAIKMFVGLEPKHSNQIS